MKRIESIILQVIAVYALCLLLLTSCKSDPVEQHEYIPYIAEEDSIYVKFPIDVTNKVFNTGSGIGGYFVEFYEGGIFRTFGFCDICSGSGTIGTYTQKSNAIYMVDSLCYENKPHFTNDAEYVDCEGSTMTTYYLVCKAKAIYLSLNASDTLDPRNVEINGAFPCHELLEIEDQFTIE